MIIGKVVPVNEGLRVALAEGDKGVGTIISLLDGGSGVSVQWDDGTVESIATGAGGRYDLVSAAARAQSQGAISSSTAGNFGQSSNPQLRSPLGTIQVSNMSQFSLGNQGFPGTIQMPLQSGHISPQVMRTQQADLALKAGNHAAAAPDSQANFYQKAGNHAAVAPDSHGSLMQARSSSGGVQGSLTQSRSSPDGEQIGGSDQLHKQLLAQEVVKLRKEIQDLKAASSTQRVPKAISGESGKKEELLLELRSDIQRLERDRDEVVQKATSQKELLAREVKVLRQEVEKSHEDHMLLASQLQMDAALQTPVGQALAQRREFEERFTHALRDLRAQLDMTSIKALSLSASAPMGVRSLLQASNDRIDGALVDATKIPVEERLHIECLRIVIENGKLRKALNEYAAGLLENAMVKDQKLGADAARNTSSFFGLFV